jgi:hypothetical protein
MSGAAGTDHPLFIAFPSRGCAEVLLTGTTDMFKQSWTEIQNHYHIFGFDFSVVPWQGAGAENG